MTTKTQFSLRDAYLAVYDAQVAARRFTIADLASLADTDVATIALSVQVLAENSLVEVEPAGAPCATSILLCADAARLSRKVAYEKYMTLETSLRASRAPSAPVASVPTTVERSTTAPSDAAEQAARRVITLNERKLKGGKVRTVTSARPALWETAAIVEHRNEHRSLVPCVVCDKDYAHTTTVPISSRCYNHMRVACQVVLHSTDSAVIRWLKGATEDQLVACVEWARTNMKLTVTTVSAKQAAKAMAAALAE